MSDQNGRSGNNTARAALLNLSRQNAGQKTARRPVMEKICTGAPVRLEDLDVCRQTRDRLERIHQQQWDPFFPQYEGMGKNSITLCGRGRFLNFNTYDYLDLNGHPEVLAAGSNASQRYGFSASASRLVGGEKAVHRELELLLAGIYQTEDCVAFVSGHATNVSTLATLFGTGDIIFHDSLAHNSLLQGAMLSHATRIPFPHNDIQALDRILTERRGRTGHAVIVSEGLFSMDGCLGNLPELIRLKKKHRCFLMIDEAHSLGTLGKTGLGVWEHFGVAPGEVDIWMGTLSKTACACGGYIASSGIVVAALKNLAPGFVYSVGMSPPLAAAATTALSIMMREPERVEKLRHNARLFYDLARQQGLDTGKAEGHAVIPIMTGNSQYTFHLSKELHDQGLCVMPVMYPAVEEHAARLRFFLSAGHCDDDIRQTVDRVAATLSRRHPAGTSGR